MAKILGGVIVVVIVIGAFFVWQGKKASVPLREESEVQKETSQTPEEKSSDMVASIKDAMGLGRAMQCTYMTNEGDVALATSSTVTVEGQKFKSVTVMKDRTISTLSDGENQYTWMSDSKEGIKMSKSCLDKAKEMMATLPKASTTNIPQTEDVQKSFDTAKDVQCTPGGSLDLSLPSDVTFKDQCAMMEQSLKMMEQLKGKMPQGIPTPSPQPY